MKKEIKELILISGITLIGVFIISALVLLLIAFLQWFVEVLAI